MKSRQLIDTAHHEAGHAVAAYYQHVNIRYVTINPEKDSLGHVRNTRVQFGRDGVFDDSLRGIDRAERRIVVLYAGPIASRKLSPRSRWRVGGSSDFDIARDLFTHIDSPDQKYRNLYAALLWRRAELIVETRWKDIRAVAAALLKQRMLDRKAVSNVIDSANGLKPMSFSSARK
jgi:hypothetical protein